MRKVERKLKKHYPTIVSADLLFKEDELSKSRIFEWLIVNQLKAEFFWRDPYKNEVDIVLDKKIPLPVEIKYGEIDIQGVSAFMRKFKVNHGVIITRNKEGKHKVNGSDILFIPAFKFLLNKKLFTASIKSE